MSASSSSGAVVDDLSPDALLARRLQEEDDAVLAAELAAEMQALDVAPQRRTAPAPARSQPSHDASAAIPVMVPARERLAAPAHKAVTHLGRNTAAAIQKKHGIGPSLEALLKLLDTPRRPEVLAMVDIGQRDRVEAELTALRLDLM